jgi:hypothetical protein
MVLSSQALLCSSLAVSKRQSREGSVGRKRGGMRKGTQAKVLEVVGSMLRRGVIVGAVRRVE